MTTVIRPVRAVITSDRVCVLYFRLSRKIHSTLTRTTIKVEYAEKEARGLNLLTQFRPDARASQTSDEVRASNADVNACARECGRRESDFLLARPRR